MRQFCRKRVCLRFFRNFILKYSAKLNFDSPAAKSLFLFFPVKVFRFTEKNEFVVIEIYDAYKTGYFRFEVRVS